MGAIRLFSIRIAATIVIIISGFILCWYLLSRYNQLESKTTLVYEGELNTPRLKTETVEKIISDFDERNYYSSSDSPKEKIPEKDPFYN